MSDIVPGEGLPDYKILGKDIKEGMILRMQKHLPCIGSCAGGYSAQKAVRRKDTSG